MPDRATPAAGASASFGERVRRARTGHGWTQQELADRAGFDRKSISRVETGTYSPSLDRVAALADALGVPIADLVAGLGGPKN